MCSKIAPPRLKPTTSVIKKESTAAKIKAPARKTRTKTRKPKYLSLRLELSSDNHQHSPHMTTTATASTSDHHHHQLNLFPLHPEHLVDDKLDTHEDNMASFFSTADGATTTLTGLLSAAGTSSSSDEDNTTVSPSSLNYGYSEEGELVRTAMRNKERDASEEKWVCYSEVVEKKEDEVTSSSAIAAERRCKIETTQGGFSLKLDYDEIMNAWCDKGPLYIHMESPQTVPVLHDDDFLSSSSAAAVSGLWRVPEMETNMDVHGRAIQQDCMAGGVQSQREASVRRYKEKRQNRLFAKKIRYQVRKLNAEKRPRVKGRFVKKKLTGKGFLI